jgi:AraC family transcriptional regulator, transcriptional activator of pobA
MTASTRLVRHRQGVPIYEYRSDPTTPPVSLLRIGDDDIPERRLHIHDFPVLWYDSRAGLVYVVAAGEVIDPGRVSHSDSGVGVFFDPAALGEAAQSPWPTWQAHPLLFPFLHGSAGGLLELQVPEDRRRVWDSAMTEIEIELAQRADGYRQAALAHLTLLLIEVARLAANVAVDWCRRGEPLLADVFTVIDRRHAERLSLRDVACEIGMTPGHLTTIVRRRTGRTVQEWITERRMAEARTLLAETELPIREIAHRVGIPDAAYFSRRFRQTHDVSPRSWRGRRGAIASAHGA